MSANSTAGQEQIPSSQRSLAEEQEKIDYSNREGRKIFEEYLKKLKDPKFYDLDPQSKYEYFQKQYPDFARSNPIILRYISLGLFSEKANFLYFKQCFMYVTKTDEDFCNRQADFVKYLYIYTTKIRGAALEKIWVDTKEALMAEIKEFNVEREKYQAERATRKGENNKLRNEAIKSAIQKAIATAKQNEAARKLAEAKNDSPGEPEDQAQMA